MEMNNVQMPLIREMTIEEARSSLKNMSADELAVYVEIRNRKIIEDGEMLEMYKHVYAEKVTEALAKEPWRALDYNNDKREWGATTHFTCWQRYWLEHEFKPMMESLVPHDYKWSESSTIRFAINWCMKNQNRLTHVSDEELKQYFKDTYPDRP